MKLYNTRTRTVEPFPPGENKVTIYVCGITPYDTTHLGHAFTYCMADTLIRYLELRGYAVIYVQNVTDIDDDILRKARETGQEWRALGDRWTRHFVEDMTILNVRPPNYFPRATATIPQIVTHVQALLQTGVAYEAGGNVYFSVDSWPAFGHLSHLPRAEMLPIANERGNHPDDPHKKDPLDFVLWQAQAEGEPAWSSPWGLGRPGWHIECSTMATHLLGQTIDLHAGGADLLFPHHECEIAQVEPVSRQPPFARFWMHMAMVEKDGEKMSKSLGNLVMVRDLLERYSADALRLYLGQHHYRDPWGYGELELEKAAGWEAKFLAALEVAGTGAQAIDTGPVEERFTAAMDNDLDTSQALASLLNLADEILFRAPNGYQVAEAQALLRRLGRVFGLRLGDPSPEARVSAGWSAHGEMFT